MPKEDEITLRNLHERLTRVEQAILELNKSVDTLKNPEDNTQQQKKESGW